MMHFFHGIWSLLKKITVLIYIFLVYIVQKRDQSVLYLFLFFTVTPHSDHHNSTFVILQTKIGKRCLNGLLHPNFDKSFKHTV